MRKVSPVPPIVRQWVGCVVIERNDMSEPKWTDERIVSEIRNAMSEVVVYSTDLASFVVPQVLRVARDIYAELNAANETIAEKDELIAKLEKELVESVNLQRILMLDKLKKELDIVTADRDMYREIVFKENERDALKRELAEKQRYILQLEAQLEWEPLSKLTLEDGRTMIVDLEAREASLQVLANELTRRLEEAQLAKTWKPLPDGFFQSSINTGLYAVSVSEDFLKLHMRRMGEWHDVGVVVLPDNIRLCCRKEQP